MSKHAYLIMAHHHPDLLRKLIDAIDDERNEIFIHIDKKTDESLFDCSTKTSKVHIIEPMNVNWGGYSQIDCEYRLFFAAYKTGPYEYYHLLTGSTFPLKSQNDIHDFFDKNQGKLFIGYDEKNDFSFRAKLYFAFNEIGKASTIWKKIKWKIRKLLLSVQKLINYNILSGNKVLNSLVIKKGVAYVSITNDFVKYILDKEDLVKKLLKHSISGDEVFIQTLAYNSDYKENIFNFNHEFEGCMRELAWSDAFGYRPGHNFTYDDLIYLLNSKRCFALKFEGPDGIKLIEEIRKEEY